jgi:hypothetical protein
LWAQPEQPAALVQEQAILKLRPNCLRLQTRCFRNMTEETAIAPRKPFPAAPALAEPLPPEQHFAALKLIREEIGDCTRCALAKGATSWSLATATPMPS